MAMLPEDVHDEPNHWLPVWPPRRTKCSPILPGVYGTQRDGAALTRRLRHETSRTFGKLH